MSESRIPTEEEDITVPIPYIPLIVDIDSLDEKGFLLNSQNHRSLRHSGLSLQSIQQSGSSSSLPRTLFAYFASPSFYIVDHRYCLGGGAFGKVYLAQNNNNWKEWIALKEIKRDQKTQEERKDTVKKASDESSTLEILNETLFQKEFGQSVVIGMKLHPGIPLKQMIDKTDAKKVKPIHFLNMFNSMLDSLNEVHEKKIIHRDIKPANMIYDRTTHKVKLVDFGLAVKGTEVKESYFSGNLGYAAPELRDTTGYQNCYNAKTDIYAIGLCIGQMLGFVKPTTDRYALLHHPILHSNQTPFSDDIALQIYDFLQRITHTNPKQRPSIAEIKTFFEKIKLEYLQTLDMINRVICLDIADYEKATDDEKIKMHIQLGKADEVWLIDSSTDKHKPFQYAKLRHRLENEGIKVASEVIQATSDYTIPLTAYQKKREQQNNNIYICSILNKNGTLTEPSIISEIHFNRIIDSLQKDSARLRMADIKTTSGKERLDRAGVITQFTDRLKLKYKAKQLNYTSLEAALNQLQTDLLSKRRTVRFLQNLSITLFDTNSRKNVSKQLDELKKAKKLSR